MAEDIGDGILPNWRDDNNFFFWICYLPRLRRPIDDEQYQTVRWALPNVWVFVHHHFECLDTLAREPIEWLPHWVRCLWWWSIYVVACNRMNGKLFFFCLLSFWASRQIDFFFVFCTSFGIWCDNKMKWCVTHYRETQIGLIDKRKKDLNKWLANINAETRRCLKTLIQ